MLKSLSSKYKKFTCDFFFLLAISNEILTHWNWLILFYIWSCCFCFIILIDTLTSTSKTCLCWRYFISWEHFKFFRMITFIKWLFFILKLLELWKTLELIYAYVRKKGLSSYFCEKKNCIRFINLEWLFMTWNSKELIYLTSCLWLLCFKYFFFHGLIVVNI